MDMLDSLVKAPIIGLYIAFIPLLWCFAVHALNHACIADEWLYKVCYCFFAFSEMCCSFAMMYSLYRFFTNIQGWKAGVFMKNMTVIVNCFDYKAIAQKAHRINKLPSIVCYERPADFPKKFVARLFYLGDKTITTNVVVTGDTYAELLEKINPVLDYLGMVKFNRAPGDDNCIMEVWLQQQLIFINKANELEKNNGKDRFFQFVKILGY